MNQYSMSVAMKHYTVIARSLPHSCSAFLCIQNLQQRNRAVLCVASIAAWRRGDGGSSGDGNGDDARFPGWGDSMMACDSDEARMCARSITLAPVQPLHWWLGTWAALWAE